jgi:uncharacterized coiled-coil DUF342 family protein
MNTFKEPYKCGMSVQEALEWADKNSQDEVVARMRSRAVAKTLASEVRRFQGKIKELEDRCDVCGAKILGPCGICGAPQCCVQCCKIEMFKERAEAAEARCTKYTTEIAGLHEKLEAAEAKCAELELKLKEAASVQV